MPPTKKKVTSVSVKPKSIIKGQEANIGVLEHAIKNDMPVLLLGETGTGKTTIVRELALKNNKTFIRVNLNGQTSTDEFVGKWLIKNQQTVWTDGVLIDAMKKGHWLLCDEVNAALPEILFVLHSLLDDDKQVLIAEKDGEVVKPHPEFRFFATMNPTEDYAGTKELNKAFMSRFVAVLKFEYPDPATEASIIIDRTKASTPNAMAMVEFANTCRKQKLDGNIYHTVSTRDLIFWGEMMQKFPIEESFRFCILNKASESDKEIIMRIWAESARAIKVNVDKYKINDIQSFTNLIDKRIRDAKAAEAKLVKSKRALREQMVPLVKKEVIQELKEKIQKQNKSALQAIEEVDMENRLETGPDVNAMSPFGGLSVRNNENVAIGRSSGIISPIPNATLSPSAIEEIKKKFAKLGLN